MSELYFQSLFCLLWIATWYSFPFPMQAAEYHMVDLFERANLCAIHAKRVTISKLSPNEHLFSFAVLCNIKHAIVVKVFQYQGHLCFNLVWYLVSILFDVQLSEWDEWYLLFSTNMSRNSRYANIYGLWGMALLFSCKISLLVGNSGLITCLSWGYKHSIKSEFSLIKYVLVPP